MRKYSPELVSQIRYLRSQGKTYSEIASKLNTTIPKSSLSYLVKGVQLPDEFKKRIEKLNFNNLNKGRVIAKEIIKIKRERFFEQLAKENLPISGKVQGKDIAKIALSMLCLGEASKYGTATRSFYLGSSDPRIIKLFLGMLKYCFDFDIEKVRCTVQCRADQHVKELEQYWLNITGVPKRLFYKAQVDPRTVGKPTKKADYKGVLRIDYFDTKVQLDLECLANLIYNQFSGYILSA